MQVRLATLIDKARGRLTIKPIDATHDLEHHKNVAANCQKIIEEEHLSVNPQNILIAAWWHDVESQRGETNLLQKEMRKLGFEQEDIESISNIIHLHTFGEKPETNEAKVLFDADKIEYFNPDRIRKALKDAKNGLLPILILRKHYLEWVERHEKILESFNFETSKKIALTNLPRTLSEIKEITSFLETNNRIG